MGWYIRLSLALFVGILLSLNPCFADTKGIKYSMPPTCREGNVVCGENEEAVCLNPNDPKDISYVSLTPCDGEPKCVGKDGLPAPGIVLDCVEFAQCQNDIAHCSDGKTAKCLGNDNECKCSEQICDYTWEISNAGSYQ